MFAKTAESVDLSELDDTALMWRVARRHPDALSELYDRHRRLVFSVAYHTVSDFAVAEEITQEVFFRAWTRAEDYDPTRAQVSTWLVSIARHRSIDVLRQQRARPEQHGVAWAELEAGEEPRVEDAAERAELHLVQSRVRAAVASLPPEQRTALALAYFQGLTQQEIAATLDQPLGTVKTRIRLAMQKLREMLVDAV